MSEFDPKKLIEEYNQLRDQKVDTSGLDSASEAQRKIDNASLVSNFVQNLAQATGGPQFQKQQSITPLLQQMGQRRMAQAKDNIAKQRQDITDQRKDIEGVLNQYRTQKSFEKGNRLKDLQIRGAEIDDAFRQGLTDPNSRTSALFKKSMASMPGIKEDPELIDQINKSSGIELQKMENIYRDISRLYLEGKRVEADELKAELKEGQSPTFREKETIKTALKAKKDLVKENTKIHKKQTTNKTKIEQKIKDIQSAIDKAEAYKKSTTFGTGPLATGFGLKSYVDTDLQELDAVYNKLALQEMGQMFEGMSKAIDSDSERRFFEKTQPNSSNDDDVNIEILKAAKARAEENLKIINKDQQYYKESGGLFPGDIDPTTQIEQEYTPVNPEMLSTESAPTESSFNPDTEIRRRDPKTGKTAIYDKETKKPLRWEK